VRHEVAHYESEDGLKLHRLANDMYEQLSFDPQNPFHLYFSPGFIAKHIDFRHEISVKGKKSWDIRDMVKQPAANKYLERQSRKKKLGRPPVNTVLFNKAGGYREQILKLMGEVERKQDTYKRKYAQEPRFIYESDESYFFADSRGRKGGGGLDIRKVHRKRLRYAVTKLKNQDRYVIHHFEKPPSSDINYVF